MGRPSPASLTRPPTAPAMPEEDASPQRNLCDYGLILRERFWISLPLALLVACGFAYLQSRALPLFLGSASVRVEAAADLARHIELARSEAFSERAIGALTSAELQFLHAPYADELTVRAQAQRPVSRDWLGTLRVTPSPASSLLTFEAIHRDPAAAALLANHYASQFIGLAPATLLAPAVPALAPHRPNRAGIVFAASLLGVGVFFVIAFGLAAFDDRLKTAADVERHIGTRLVGRIPDLSQIPEKSRARLVLEHAGNRPAESLLGVYAAVNTHSRLDFPKAILVTATLPDEGKTLVAANLAAAFALHGKRTLLIDCNLRDPELHHRFERENDAGLHKWFESGAHFEPNEILAQNPELGIQTLTPHLSLLRAGGRTDQPTDLLGSPAFTKLIERLKREYELLVVDSPPLGTVADALVISENTDEVLYVGRYNHPQRKHIRLYLKALRQGKNEILGVVLNGLGSVRPKHDLTSPFYRSYKKHYGTTT